MFKKELNKGLKNSHKIKKKLNRIWIQRSMRFEHARGLGSDAHYLEILEKQNPFGARLKIMDRGFDGKENLRLIFTI
jgi:hypothetical protein